jgi:iron complex transport system ATP-binding protein
MDMQHTMEMLNLAADRVSDGALVIAVMQDVNLAAMYCDHLVCMRSGEVYASGPLETVLDSRTLRAVFHVRAQVSHNAYSGSPQVAFKREVRP